MTSTAKRSPWQFLAMCIALIVALVAFTPVVQGQTNATVNGTVTDPTGSVVPNAKVSLTDNATGQVTTVVSNSVGAFSFPSVNIGTFTLTITASGFETYTKIGIVVHVADTLEENAMLKVGVQAQSVTVEAAALQVQTETNTLSTLLSGTQVEELATNGNNFTAVAALGLGVSDNLPQFSGIMALTSAAGISFNGTREDHNVYLLDGGELNDRGCGGCFMDLPSMEAIAEFQTLDSNFSPEYGIGSGGIIVMDLKSGTSKYHGEVYEFNRNTDYDANDYFAKQANEARPEFDLNIPGFNIAGPLIIPHVYNPTRNRTFFFWNEEWRRFIQGSAPSVVNTIEAGNFPTAGQNLDYTLPPGDTTAPIVPNLPNNATVTGEETSDLLTPGSPFPTNGNGQYIIPANMMDANAVIEMNAGTFPKPNLPNGYQFTTSIPAITNVREDVVRIDQTINSKMQLMGSYVHDNSNQVLFPSLWTDSSYPTIGSTMANPSYTAALKLTQTYSSNLLNETGFYYSGNKIALAPIAAAGYSYKLPSTWTGTSFFPVANNASDGMPSIQLQGTPFSATWDENYFPWKNGYEGFQYRDDLSWMKGKHQFSFGASWLHTYKNQELQYDTNGVAAFNSSNFSGDAYVNFLLGEATTFSQLNYLTDKHWVNNNYGFYGNDNWHVTSRLTLNIGLRYDGLPHTFERYNQFANFVPSDYNTSLGDPLTTAGTINPTALTTFVCNTIRCNTNGDQFYLNGMQVVGQNGIPRPGVHQKFDTIEPRVGFAWDIFGDGKTSLRGGFGMFYERIQGNEVYDAALDTPFAYEPAGDDVDFSNPHTSILTGATTNQSYPANMTTMKYQYNNPGTAEFSLGVQRQIAPSVVAVVQYVGTIGWDQSDDRGINTLPLIDANNSTNPYDDREAVANGTVNPNLYRNYLGYSNMEQEEEETNVNYNALQAGIRIDNRWGLTTQFSYTWSHTIDVVNDDLEGLSDPYNPRYDYGSDDALDRRQIFNASYVYALPFFNKHTGNLAEREILGGWSISGITTAQSGVPAYIYYTGSDVVGLGGDFTNRPNKVSPVSYPKTEAAWFSKSSFANPVAPWNGGPNEGFGSAGKDAVVGPGLFNWNLSLYKNVQLSPNGRWNLQLRFETFNTFNQVQLSGIDQNSADGNFAASTVDYGPRNIEFGGKIMF